MLYLLVCLAFCSSAYAWVDVTDRIAGRVVHFESLRIRGEWVYTSSYYDYDSMSHFVKADPYLERDVAYVPRIQFKASICASKYLCFESLELKGRFMYGGYTSETGLKTVLIRKDTYPEADFGNHWIVKCETDAMEKCTLTSRRFENQPLVMIHQFRDDLDKHQKEGDYYTTLGNPKIDKLEPYQYYRIYAPNPSDQMVEMLTVTNDLDAEHIYKRKMTFGVSQTESQSHTMLSSTTMEIGGAFKSFSASASTTIESSWTTESSSTYESKIEMEIDITVPAFSVVKVYQLKGYYTDQFEVFSEVYDVVGEDLKTGRMSKKKSGKLDFSKSITIDGSKTGKEEL